MALSHFAGPRLITLHGETTRSRNKTNNSDILISVLRIMICPLNFIKFNNNNAFNSNLVIDNLQHQKNTIMYVGNWCMVRRKQRG